MIILDHNIAEDQTEQLWRRQIHFRQIGYDIGRPEWDDQQEILRYLHGVKRATFFTRDLGFFHLSFAMRTIVLLSLRVPCLKRLL